jgi:hypothetical protein
MTFGEVLTSFHTFTSFEPAKLCRSNRYAAFYNGAIGHIGWCMGTLNQPKC